MNTFIARSPEEIAEAHNRLSEAKVLGCDTETGGLDPRRSKLYSVQFSDGEFSVLVPVSEGTELGPLARLLEDPQVTVVFHNARFDLGFLAANDYAADGFFCTMLAEKLLTRGADQSVSLAETLYRYFAVDLDKSRRQRFTRRWDGIWTADLVEYALADVFYLPELMRRQTAWLEELGLTDAYAGELEKLRSQLGIER